MAKTISSVDSIFSDDEMQLRSVNPRWTQDELLSQDGIFFLKDVARKLNVPSALFKKRAQEAKGGAEVAWQKMGIRKLWTHWIVRMKVFGPYFQKSDFQFVRKINRKWDANILLAQQGTFLLREVCEKLPISAQALRYQARKDPKTWRHRGVRKEAYQKGYLVDMEDFSRWLKTEWESVSFD